VGCLGLAAIGLTFVTSATTEIVPSCRGFEALLRVATGDVRSGSHPEFTLSVRNTSLSPLRLLDIRGGRRRDLGDTYYSLVIRTRDGKEPKTRRVISDPGAIADEDFVTIAPGEGMQVTVTTSLVLESLQRGAYRAHVVVWVDPYNLASRCRTDDVEFRVR
jgi:hypothetical protein